MELILKKDVENLGFTDDLVTVKNGYGRNFLIPQGHAVLATPSAKKVLAETLKQRAFKEKKVIEDAQKEADKLNGLEIKISAKSGEGDKLFGSISNADVSPLLKKKAFLLRRSLFLLLEVLLNVLGNTKRQFVFHRDVVATLPFDVVAEAK